MNTVTLISKDKHIFKISEYQAEKFQFLNEAENIRIPMILPTVCTSNDILSKWSKVCNKKSSSDLHSPFQLMIRGEILKLLLQHSDIYMDMEEEKIKINLSKYVNQVCLLSRIQRFELIRAAEYLQYENINTLTKMINV